MAREDWGMDGCFKRGRDSPKKNLFTTSRVPPPVSLMEGSFFVTPEQIRFVELKGKVGDSPITFRAPSPRPLLLLLSLPKKLEKAQAWPNRSEDFPSKSLLHTWTSIRSFQRKRDPPQLLRKIRGWLLNGRSMARWRLTTENIAAFVIKIWKGRWRPSMEHYSSALSIQIRWRGFLGRGWIKPTERGINFEMKPRVSNMEAKALIRTVFQKEEKKGWCWRGRVHIDKVELRRGGREFSKNERVPQWKFKVRNRGREWLRGGKPCQECFSILNVSQLFMEGSWFKNKGTSLSQYDGDVSNQGCIASTEDFLVGQWCHEDYPQGEGRSG